MSTNFPNGIASQGIPVIGGGIPATFGDVWFVDYTNGSDDNSGKRKDKAFKTLNKAYDVATSGNDDMILMRAHSASHVISEALDWSKSRIHVIGLDGGGRLIQQGVKVSSSGTSTDAYVMKNTGTRNSFRNIKFIQASTDASALTVLQMGGEGNLYENVTATFGVVDNLDGATTYEVVCGEDSGTFINCEFGTETLLTSAARSVMAIDQVTTSQEFKSNRFYGCNFVISSSETTATLLKVVATTDVLFSNNFKDCTFVASIDSAGGVALAVAVKSVASLVKGTLNFHNCAGYGATNFASDAVGNDNFYVYGAPNATSTDMVGTLPVAT